MKINISTCNILIVDDIKSNIDLLVRILGDKYKVSVATNGSAAIKYVEEKQPDLILLDIMMPDMDGYEVMKRLKRSSSTKDIPVILVSALTEITSKSEGFKLGAVDYIIKPFEVEEVLARVKTHLQLKLAQKELASKNIDLESIVKLRTKELSLTQQATIMSMAILAEYRDHETGEHIKRVKEYVEQLCFTLKNNSKFKRQLTDDYVELLVLSCPLHDIGKVAISDNILLKPGKLTPEEYEKIKMHTTYGRDVIINTEKIVGEISFLKIAKEVIYTHHEKWDGTGYPNGLRGDEIPISGRIMAIADVFDALTSKRVYKEAFTSEKAVNIIHKEKGKYFDPDVTDAFMENIHVFNEIAMKYKDVHLVEYV